MGKPNDPAPGRRNLLLLKTASLEPKHGWATAKRIQQIRAEVLPLQQASLYPDFDRLEQRGTDQGQLSQLGQVGQVKRNRDRAASQVLLIDRRRARSTGKEAANRSRLSASDLAIEAA